MGDTGAVMFETNFNFCVGGAALRDDVLRELLPFRLRVDLKMGLSIIVVKDTMPLKHKAWSLLNVNSKIAPRILNRLSVSKRGIAKHRHICRIPRVMALLAVSGLISLATRSASASLLLLLLLLLSIQSKGRPDTFLLVYQSFCVVTIVFCPSNVPSL